MTTVLVSIEGVKKYIYAKRPRSFEKVAIGNHWISTPSSLWLTFWPLKWGQVSHNATTFFYYVTADLSVGELHLYSSRDSP